MFYVEGIEAIYMTAGLPAPGLRYTESQDNMIDLHCQHLKSLLEVKYIGYKSTMMTLAEIQDCVDEGSQVILMRRSDSYGLLKSWLGRIDPSLDSSFLRLYNYYLNLKYRYIHECLENDVLIVDFHELMNSTESTLSTVSDFFWVLM